MPDDLVPCTHETACCNKAVVTWPMLCTKTDNKQIEVCINNRLEAIMNINTSLRIANNRMSNCKGAGLDTPLSDLNEFKNLEIKMK